MFKAILAPVDGTQGSSKALEVAAQVAGRFEAKIHLLFVVEPYILPYPTGFSYQELINNATQMGQDVVEAAAEELLQKGVKHVEKHTLQGHPAPTILECVERFSIELIVIGTHGRRGLDRILLGSVAEEVVRRSHVPVLSVHLRDEA